MRCIAIKKNDFSFYESEEVNSLVELVERSERLYGDSVAVAYKVKKQIVEKTYKELLADSKKTGQMLLRKGLKTGHVALLGVSSYEWIVSYYGVMYAGLVVVPIDKELTTAEIYDEVVRADVDMLIYDNIYADVACELQAMLGTLEIACMNEPYDLPGEALPFPEVDPDKLSTIIFTSGTTGKSKGVMLTQRNIARNVSSGVGHIKPVHGKDVAMSVLPMNHAYESTGTVFLMTYCGVKICICSGLKYIAKELAEYKPTVMFVVPLIVEKLYQKVWQTAKKQGKEKTLALGIKICKAAKKLGLDITDKVLGDVKAAFGGRLRLLMCGGAKLEEYLVDGCQEIGINLFQGYGLSECSPLLAANFDKYYRGSSVGRVCRDCEVKIVDGEIWARGISVSKGYYNDPESTERNFTDGWFMTGDLGYLDEDNFLYVTGRKKNLIILGNGKNVSAEELESTIYHKLDYVSEVVVYGKNDKIYAEIYQDPEKPQLSQKQVNADIALINKELAFYKNIAGVILRDEPFPRTTTKKIIRYGVK